MSDQPSTMRDRIDAIARLVDRGFNGDREKGDHVSFVLLSWHRDGDEDKFCMINNGSPDHQVKHALIVALSQAGEDDQEPVAGHA